MQYNDMNTERLQELLRSDQRVVDLIWASEHGQILKWDTPAGEMSGKMDTVDGLMSRIRVVTKVLKKR